MKIMDAICLLIVLMYVVLGLKRGVLKEGVSLIGTIAVLIIAFVLKDVLANFFMSVLPFFDFPGIFHGITAMNVLIYEVISFIAIFVILYCVLNILLTVSGFIEKLLKLTIVLAIPSKILGAILGLVEGLIMAFIVTFILYHIPLTERNVHESKVAIVVLERTPIISNVSIGTTKALEKIVDVLKDVKTNEDREDANFKVLHVLVNYKIITESEAQKLIDDKKIVFSNTVTL